MGSNKNKNNEQQGPGAPRDEMRNQTNYQNQRYESQQAPLANSMSYNYGRGSEADYGNYTDIMNNYRDIASGSGSGGGSGGGGGGGAASNYSAFTVNPERVNAAQASTERAGYSAMGPTRQLSVDKLSPLERVTASNPYNSYAGMEEFSKTGGYSGQDINDMRARGMAPIRAAYANAERNVGQQRSLQGGYSPNAIAAQVKMAREQGQGMADAATNVNAGIADARNKGRLSGLQGMGNIEQARANQSLDADKFNSEQARMGNQYDIDNQFNTGKFNIGNEFETNKFNTGNMMDISKFNAGEGNSVNTFNAGQMNDVGKYNAGLNFQGQTYNADAQTQAEARNNASAEAAASRNAAAAAQSNDDRFRALAGMTNLYGTTPGMSNTFGNQATNIVGQGANQGIGMINANNMALNQPGRFEQTTDRMGAINNIVNNGANVVNAFRNQPPSTYNSGGIGPTTPPYVPSGSGYSNGNISFPQPSFGQQPSISQQRRYF
jgi:hypothetical protein